MSMLINAPLRLAILSFLTRIIHTFIAALFSGKKEAMLWIRAHIFLTKILKLLVMHRLYRSKIYRNHEGLERLFDKCIYI